MVNMDFELKRYLLDNSMVMEQYKMELIKDCMRWECDEEETNQFIEECMFSFEHFKMFMPSEATRLRDTVLK